MDILALQKALQAAGFNPGPLDGVPGPLTSLAIKAFQKSKGLDPDGIVGTLTSKALGLVPPLPPALAFAGMDSYAPPNAGQLGWLKGRISWLGGYIGGPSSAPSSYAPWRKAFMPLLADGWGVAPVYVGGQWSGPGSHDVSPARGGIDGRDAVKIMKDIGFKRGSCVYLDQEAPMAASQEGYTANWCAAVEQGGFKPGVYCSFLSGPRVAVIVPRARIWVYHMRIATKHYPNYTTFPNPAPSLSGFPGATNWQLENEARIPTPFGELAVDLNSSFLPDPSAPDAAPLAAVA